MSTKFYFLESSIDEAGAVKFIGNEHPYLKNAVLLDKKGMEKRCGTETAYKSTLLWMLTAFHYYPSLMKVFREFEGGPMSLAPEMMEAMFDKAVSMVEDLEDLEDHSLIHSNLMDSFFDDDV